ncbi:hypothetical protein Trydic_g20397 [Trypoxylus dichotomus]
MSTSTSESTLYFRELIKPETIPHSTKDLARFDESTSPKFEDRNPFRKDPPNNTRETKPSARWNNAEEVDKDEKPSEKKNKEKRSSRRASTS